MHVETKFLIPLKEDSSFGGEKHPYTRWQKLQTDLFIMFEGWTVSSANYRGVYKDPDSGEMVSDESVQYMVTLDEKKVPELRDYLRDHVSVAFRQKAYIFTMEFQ